MKHGALILAVVLALCAVLYFTTPAATEIIGTVANPIRGLLDRVVRLVTGMQERAKPAALALYHTFPEGAGGLEGTMLAICEHESGFVAGVTNRLGYAGPYQTRPRYFPDANVYDFESITPAIAVTERVHWNRVLGYTTDYDLAAILTYCSHGEGGAVLDAGLHEGVTWASFCAAVKAKLAYRTPKGTYMGPDAGFTDEQRAKNAARKADGFWNTAAGYYKAGSNAKAWQEWYDGLDFAALEAGAPTTEGA